jgi:methyl-accepting chemotaxis protein
MRLSLRLAFGFGVLLATLVLIVFIAFMGMNNLSATLQKLRDNSSAKMYNYNKLESSTLILSQDLQNLLLYQDRKNIVEEIKKIQEQRENYNKFRAEIDKTETAGEGRAIRANIEKNAQICNPMIDKIIELVLANKKAEASLFFLEKTKGPLVKWQDSVTAANDYLNSEIGQESGKADKNLFNIMLVISGLGGVALIFGIIVSVSTTKGITRSVNRVTNNIVEGVNQVASASTQLSASSQQLSQGSSEQASAIDEVSATLEETASMLQQNTSNTAQAAQLSEQAKGSADKGGVEMQEMMNSMQEIKRSSDQIAKIIKVIDEIAFQTNILALNAAIEAARAGESGMGFAVVAEEVRNLAQKSAQAAQETSAIIEANIDLSGQGVVAAERVRGVLAEITSHTKKVNELMAEISAASQEQLQGVDQINLSVAQVATVTQQNAATAEESAAAAEEMNAQADGMKKMVYQLLTLINGKSFAKKKEVEYASYEIDHVARHQAVSSAESTDKKTIVSPEDVIPLEKDPHHF